MAVLVRQIPAPIVLVKATKKKKREPRTWLDMLNQGWKSTMANKHKSGIPGDGGGGYSGVELRTLAAGMEKIPANASESARQHAMDMGQRAIEAMRLRHRRHTGPLGPTGKGQPLKARYAEGDWGPGTGAIINYPKQERKKKPKKNMAFNWTDGHHDAGAHEEDAPGDEPPADGGMPAGFFNTKTDALSDSTSSDGPLGDTGFFENTGVSDDACASCGEARVPGHTLCGMCGEKHG